MVESKFWGWPQTGKTESFVLPFDRFACPASLPVARVQLQDLSYTQGPSKIRPPFTYTPKGHTPRSLHFRTQAEALLVRHLSKQLCKRAGSTMPKMEERSCWSVCLTGARLAPLATKVEPFDYVRMLSSALPQVPFRETDRCYTRHPTHAMPARAHSSESWILTSSYWPIPTTQIHLVNR